MVADPLSPHAVATELRERGLLVDPGRELRGGIGAADLGGKRVLITYPMRDSAFRPKQVLPRMRGGCRDVRVVELPDARHYFVEDAPDAVADAIVDRFAPRE
jgi:haloalkane dehalogenase